MKKLLPWGISAGVFLFCAFFALNAQASTPKTITGQVLNSEGTAVTNAMIVPTRTDSGDMTGVTSANTNALGNYTLSLPAADWALTVRPQTYATDWGYYGAPVIVSFNHDETVESKTQNFTVTKTDAVINGTLVYSNGNGVPNAQISAVNSEGKGTTVQSGAGGVFSIPAVAGTYSIEVGWHPEMSTQAFSRQLVTVRSGETKDIGTITASLMDSHITGTVSGVSPGFGEGMTIRAWQKNGNITLNTDTDANKSFDFTVSPGTWLLGPGGGGQSHHFFMRSPIEVTVDSHGQTVNIDFPYVAGDYFVNGTIKDENGNAVDLTGEGTIYVRDEKGQTFTNFIEGTQYQIIYPSSYATENIKVGLELLPNFSVNGSSYSFKEEVDVVMTSNHGTANLVLKKDEESISGQIRDINGNAYSSLPVAVRVVAADNHGNVKTTDVKSDGTYSLNVADGAWKVSFKILQDNTNYYLVSLDNEVTVNDKGSAVQDIVLSQTDSTISGQLLDKDGSAVARATVFAEAGDLKFKADTNDSGNFTIGVKSGLSYAMTMGVPAGLTGNLPTITHTSAGSGAATLRMQGTNATITGKVYLGNTAVTSGFVKAWTEDGAFAEASVGSDGVYSLNVTSSTIWYLAAATVNETKAYVSETIRHTPTGTDSLNISLGENYYNFPRTTIEKFYANNSVVFALGDGSVIQLPAYATGTGNSQRTLMAVPTIDLAAQTNAKTLPIGYNLEIRDENNVKITNFNQPITIIFAWNRQVADSMGADTASLEPRFWDSGQSIWRDMGMNILNTENNTNVVVTDHLTSFGLTTNNLGGVKRSRSYILTLPAKAHSALTKFYTFAAKKVKQFYAFNKKKRGGFEAISADFTGDTIPEVLVYSASDTKLGMQLLTKNGTKIHKKALFPFGKKYKNGYTVAAQDLDFNGTAELIVANRGKGSIIKVYKYYASSFKLWKKFKPYGKSIENVNFVFANLTNSRAGKEIVVTAKNQALVKVYYFKGKFKFLKSVKPYGKKLNGELNLAAGDLNNDSKDELIVAPKKGQIRKKAKVYKFTSKFVYVNSFFSNISGNGIYVQTGDINADSRDEIIAYPEISNVIRVRAYRLSGKKVKQIKTFVPFLGTAASIRTKVADLNRDGKAEIVVAPATGKIVKIYKYAKSKFSLHKRFKPYGKSFSKGINLGLVGY